MGRGKKKPSSPKQEGEGSVTEAAPARKRGRPRKVVEKTVQTEEEDHGEEEEGEKSKKLSSAAESSSSKGKNKAGEKEEEEDPMESSAKIVKRPGMRRRKGEPRRAAD